ncbi:MAG: hypothetical protein K0R84_1541 [Clostridia bacterium]|jgi:prepilin-type N-terminal cleavage/methylation domain-containing protein|nr:hypothetical protein [Clostridia bacterium]
MMKHLRKKDGFTLIELLITLAILGIVIIPLSRFAISSTKINSDAKALLDSNSIAQTYMENWKAKNLSSLIDASKLESLNQGNPVQLPEEDYEGYQVQTTIVPVNQYSTIAAEDYTPDMIIKINETTGKLSVYQSSEFKIADLALQPEYVIDVEKSDGTSEISISGLDGIISTAYDGSAIIQIYCEEAENVIFKVNNKTNTGVNVYISKTNESESADISVAATTGRVDVHNTVSQPYNNSLYEIRVDVKKNGKTLTSLKGSKIIEVK